MSLYSRLPAMSNGAMVQRLKSTRMSKHAFWIKEEKALPTTDPKTGWTNKSQRTGVVAVKLGMMTDMDEWGTLHPLTVLQVQNCQVVQVKSEEKEGYTSMQLGVGDKRLKYTNKPLVGHFARANVPIKRRLEEFRVTPDAILPIGTEVFASHFVPGQLVDACGISKGKGFQGPMKRWGFGGLPASHGVSLTHRSHGATGARQDPGKVWKGKKMAGHMGSERITTKNLKIYQIDRDTNTLLVVGSVPGGPGTYVRVTDAKFFKWEAPPPFPTHIPKAEEPSVMRLKLPKPKPIVDDLDEENKSWNEMLQAKFPLKLSASLEKQWEQARVNYKADLERGYLGRVIREQFPQIMPVSDDVRDWFLRLKTESEQEETRRLSKLIKQTKPHLFKKIDKTDAAPSTDAAKAANSQ